MQEAQKVIAQVDDVNEDIDEARNQIDKEQMLIAQSASMLDTAENHEWRNGTHTTGDVVKSSKDLRVAILRQEFVDELVLDRTLKEAFMRPPRCRIGIGTIVFHGGSRADAKKFGFHATPSGKGRYQGRLLIRIKGQKGHGSHGIHHRRGRGFGQHV
eukprot:scaffold37813_cov72-Attheya_sp.AAC.2